MVREVRGRFLQPASRTHQTTTGSNIDNSMSGARLTGDEELQKPRPIRRELMATPASNFVTTMDGAEIFFKDWGSGQPIMFSHGWPLSSDDWDAQMLFFLHHGYRVIAHDRRGHGRSSQMSEGHDMDHYVEDLAALTAHLGLNNAIHVGHSTGGGEVARYVARYQDRVAKAALLGAVTPVMVKKDSNPGGTLLEVFDGFRAALTANRAQFFLDVPSGPF